MPTIRKFHRAGDPTIHIIYYIAYLYEASHLTAFSGILICALLMVYAAALIDHTA